MIQALVESFMFVARVLVFWLCYFIGLYYWHTLEGESKP